MPSGPAKPRIFTSDDTAAFRLSLVERFLPFGYVTQATDYRLNFSSFSPAPIRIDEIVDGGVKERISGGKRYAHDVKPARMSSK